MATAEPQPKPSLSSRGNESAAQFVVCWDSSFTIGHTLFDNEADAEAAYDMHVAKEHTTCVTLAKVVSHFDRDEALGE